LRKAFPGDSVGSFFILKIFEIADFNEKKVVSNALTFEALDFNTKLISLL
jgi:hypothetical protein